MARTSAAPWDVTSRLALALMDGRPSIMLSELKESTAGVLEYLGLRTRRLSPGG
jgi:hypothetical protein